MTINQNNKNPTDKRFMRDIEDGDNENQLQIAVNKGQKIIIMNINMIVRNV